VNEKTPWNGNVPHSKETGLVFLLEKPPEKFPLTWTLKAQRIFQS